MGKKVNQGELAEVFGVTDVTLWDWQKQGLPILEQGERGQSNTYDTRDVIDWFTKRALEKASAPESQRDRLARLQGDDLELKLAQSRGELVPAHEVEPAWDSRVLAAAAFLTGQHSRLAAILDTTPGVEAKRDIIKSIFAEFLTRLGVDGEAMQERAEALLAIKAGDDAAALLRTFTDAPIPRPDAPDAEAPSQPVVVPVRPGEASPPVGLG
jgi:phage terminase Nu1 subunit (DNA packaging protein)